MVPMTAGTTQMKKTAPQVRILLFLLFSLLVKINEFQRLQKDVIVEFSFNYIMCNI